MDNNDNNIAHTCMHASIQKSIEAWYVLVSQRFQKKCHA